MDNEAIKLITQAGMDASLSASLITVRIQRDESNHVKSCAPDAPVLVGNRGIQAHIPLKPITELFTGSAIPQSFRDGPTHDYLFFFLTVEYAAVAFSRAAATPEKDMEFNRIYRKLKRSPDDTDGNPIFSYLQAAFRLYMSLKDVSRAEFDAVITRLAKSAKTFSRGPSSTNYIDTVATMPWERHVGILD
jgi:hypothetical protein